MNYIVFDLEWNQSAEGKECSVEHMPFEIIEIGAVKLNRQMKQISEFHRLVRPKAYKEMHFKISEVTHMDMEELSRKGQPFPSRDRSYSVVTLSDPWIPRYRKYIRPLHTSSENPPSLPEMAVPSGKAPPCPCASLLIF